MSKSWHRPTRPNTSLYMRLNVWMLRRPWFIAIIVALEAWALYANVSAWRVFMLVGSLVLLGASFANNATRGRVERAVWPTIW